MKLKSERKFEARLQPRGICHVAAAIIGSAVVGAVASTSASNKASKAADRAAGSADRTAALSEERYADWRSTYKPLGDSLVADAMQAGGVADQARAAEAAQGDVTQSFGRAREDLTHSLTAYGVNPDNGRFGASMARLNLSEAAAGAGAQNLARNTVIDKSRAFKLDVNNSGSGIPSSSLAAMSGAANSQANIANMRAGQASREAAGYGAIANTAIRGLGDWWGKDAGTSDYATLNSGFTGNYGLENYG